MDKWLVFGIIFGIVAMALVSLQPTQLAKQNQIIEDKLTAFTQKWEDRLKISNKVNNNTQT